MEKTILVTGSCGFIGSHLVHLLRRERAGWRVVSLDALTYAGNLDSLADLTDDDGHRFVMGDVSDRQTVFQIFEEEKPEYVMHLAAESHVDRSILDPGQFLQSNVLGTQVLLDAARTFGVERFLYVSTDEVYGDVGAEGSPRTEDSPLRPSSPYAASKAAADLLVQAYVRTYGVPALICRPCNHYGPGQFPEKLIPFMIRNLVDGASLPIYGDGQQQRDWLYVEDGARAMLSVLERGDIGGAYNFAAHNGIPNIDVVKLLCSLFAEIERVPEQSLLRRLKYVPDRPGHDVRYDLDDRRIRDETTWAPSVEFEEGLHKTIAWYLTHSDWLGWTESRVSPQYRELVYERRWGLS